MAYQNVGTPRFYVSHPLWALSLGVDEFTEGGNWTIEGQKQFINLNPSSIRIIGGDYNHSMDYPDSYVGFNFFMFLGHDFAANDQLLYLTEHQTTYGLETYDISVNSDTSGGGGNVPHSGWTLMGYDTSPTLGTGFRIIFDKQINCGSMLWGKYYDMPQSPDLSLTMTREYGYKTIETKGGSTLSNANWVKPPMWGGASAWELYDVANSTFNHQALSRSGRRIWDLSFSYLDSGDTFGSNQLILIKRDGAGYDPIFTTEGYEGSIFGGTGDEHWSYNLLNDPSFYSQVIHKTNGGQLPFVFQPDNSNNNPDQFAICKLDMNSFKFSQVANGVYNVKLKIREVW
tara:strand:+ start:130 stop:1158 length:1029 start_codon:yes stop_codon:yes gene_type:complete